MGDTLDWQITMEKLTQRGKHILETEQWADCKFIVGEESHQQILHGHKLILAISSPVFGAMFFGELAEKDYPILIKDVKPEVFKALLEYIYTENVNHESFEMACELCYCAKKYMLPFLVDECMEFILSEISPETACRAYEFAKLFEMPVLMDKCLRVIRENTSSILSKLSFEETEFGTLMTIFEQQELAINSEVELLSAAQRWAKAECIRKDLDPEKRESLRSVIGDAFTKIRFLTLTVQELTQFSAGSSLLDQNETMQILCNISSSDQQFPMPQGFSTNKKGRIDPRKHHRDQPILITARTNETDKIGELSMTLRESQIIHNSAVEDEPEDVEDPSYCMHRFKLERINFPVSDSTRCSETLRVDNHIYIHGLIVPTQIRNDSGSYTENLTVRLYDEIPETEEWHELLKTKFTPEVNTGTLVKLMLNKAVHIRKNKTYVIMVDFGMDGCYPMLPCRQRISCHSVLFEFGIVDIVNSVRGDLIASIIFTPDS